MAHFHLIQIFLLVLPDWFKPGKPAVVFIKLEFSVATRALQHFGKVDIFQLFFYLILVRLQKSMAEMDSIELIRNNESYEPLLRAIS